MKSEAYATTLVLVQVLNILRQLISDSQINTVKDRRYCLCLDIENVLHWQN